MHFDGDTEVPEGQSVIGRWQWRHADAVGGTMTVEGSPEGDHVRPVRQIGEGPARLIAGDAALGREQVPYETLDCGR